ncbi:hypothetical protein THAOC_07463 [Thalassiosira oceanica]|uniref:Uncharacterized protein n=1 Tax=Thalassiosira oceanica TaxID=159749 RepID=K0SXH6_THAOC|nr:hypothetical protein THAOC_07463 [Thalassiosira oceanica]|eukprot:EJK71128.1 hypothetical protein THAOC_07463 [Thalassiosira oceanica]
MAAKEEDIWILSVKMSRSGHVDCPGLTQRQIVPIRTFPGPDDPDLQGPDLTGTFADPDISQALPHRSGPIRALTFRRLRVLIINIAPPSPPHRPRVDTAGSAIGLYFPMDNGIEELGRGRRMRQKSRRAQESETQVTTRKAPRKAPKNAAATEAPMKAPKIAAAKGRHTKKELPASSDSDSGVDPDDMFDNHGSTDAHPDKEL